MFYDPLVSPGSSDFVYKLLPFIILDLILKGFAMWKAARQSQKAWFIVLLLVNSLGILPAIYLVLNRNEKISEKPFKARPASRYKR